MEYKVLGPLEVRAGDGPLPLGGEKQRALLARLLLDANHVVSRTRLIDDLWGDDPPQTAVATVQVYVSRLRKILPPGTLRTRKPGYLLDVDPGTLDLERLEQLMTESRVADPPRAAELLREALALWRGPALAEFGGEPFARSEASRLEELRLAAVEDRVDADLALGRHRELIGELEQFVTAEPHRERLRGQLMLALYRAGRQLDALAAYRSARTALDQFGLEPGAALRRLEQQILNQDTALDLVEEGLLVAGRVRLPGTLVPEPVFPFVGRDRELATLRELLARTEGGEGGLVLLAGEAGSGKTRLVRELAVEAAARGVLTCYGLSDATVTTPYQPLREWVEFLVSVCDHDALGECFGPQGAQLARLVPALEPLTGAAGEDQLGDPEGRRFVLKSAAGDFLARVARRQPLLLVLDDLHWADGETLHLLLRLARQAAEARWLVVAAYRAEDASAGVSDTLESVSRLEGVRRLRLGGLDADEVRAFIRFSADAQPSPELVSAVGELTDGAPLLVCELWRDLVASGGVEVADAQLMLTRPADELRGPERIGEVVRQRLSRLSPSTLSVIELAAVAGPRFEVAVVGAAGGLDYGELAAAVAQAVEIGTLEELPEPTPTCRFTHELVRRAVYDRISRARRPLLHLSVGEALEERYASDDERVLPELAHHFTLAAPVSGTGRAVAYNARAADAALAAAAYGEAVTRLSTALELGVDDPRERVRLQVELAQALHDTGRVGESEALLATARDSAADLAERGLAERALVKLADGRLKADPGVGWADVLPVAERAIETFEATGDIPGLAEAENLLASALVRAGRGDEGSRVRERALMHAQACGAAGLRRAIIIRLAIELCILPTPPVHEAIRGLEELVASNRDDRVLVATLGCHQSYALAMAGRSDEARAQLRASVAAIDALGETKFARSHRDMSIVPGALFLLGDDADAEQELIATWLQFRDARGDAPEGRAMQAAARLALLCCDQGRWEEAAEFLAYGEEVDQSPPAYGKVYVYLRFAAQARVAAHAGELARALDLGRAAVEVVERNRRMDDRACVRLVLAEVLRACGEPAEAEEARAYALGLYEKKGNVAAISRLRGVDGRARAA